MLVGCTGVLFLLGRPWLGQLELCAGRRCRDVSTALSVHPQRLCSRQMAQPALQVQSPRHSLLLASQLLPERQDPLTAAARSCHEMLQTCLRKDLTSLCVFWHLWFNQDTFPLLLVSPHRCRWVSLPVFSSVLRTRATTFLY